MYHPLTPNMFGFGPLETIGATFAIVAIIALVWELFWKGLALWHAARSGQWVWFIVFLLVHTVGILEIVYLIWFRANKDSVPLFPFGSPQKPSAVTVARETVIVTTSADDSSAA
jgi:hypothetical protein